MEWEKLLSEKRLGKKNAKGDSEDGRNPFERDFDRITFCSAFRRLQDKTQLFPLATTDFVRTRLTHSLEVSSVGRSLGTIIGKKLKEEAEKTGGKSDNFQPQGIGALVAATCLAHDIGNPPFGHAGEEAIQSFFKEYFKKKKNKETLKKCQLLDLKKFEGNAQGFRIITKLQWPGNKSGNKYRGLSLTCATLAAFLKYPTDSIHRIEKSKDISRKKHGFFYSDNESFHEVVEEVGMKNKTNGYFRHPLAFLMEAADDICYRIIDFEDGYRYKLIGYEKARELLHNLLEDKPVKSDKSAKKEDGCSYMTIKKHDDEIEHLRARAIGKLINEAADVFMENEDKILSGEFKEDIIGKIKSSSKLSEIHNETKKSVYNSPGVLEVEIVGFRIIPTLLEMFLDASHSACTKGGIKKATSESKKILFRFPQLLDRQDIEKGESCEYERILKVTDFVSGMTDSFAVSVYKKLTGISLPGM